VGLKVLFLYPNTYGMNMLPPAIALFSSLLKQNGHEVELFDSTYYQDDYGLEGNRINRLNVASFDPNEKGIKMKTSRWEDDLREHINTFTPDLIALSATEDMWLLGTRLLEEIEGYIIKNRTPVIIGGVFATFAPEIAIQHRLINLVCVGEGENSLIELCRRIERGDSFNDVTNLWVKQSDGSIIKNPISDPYDINKTPILDVNLFEPNRLYRPMAGKWYKMMPVETIRGCPYKCAFCNSPDQMTMYKERTEASFFRKKEISLVHKELKYFKEVLGTEYNYFWADTFLSWNEKEFEEFCDMYADIGLPFWMQTRPETVTDYKIKRLAKVGLHRITFGIEHGNPKFRKKMLDRGQNNDAIINATKVPHRHGVQFSVNNITGFPTETRELAMDTVELNRHIEADNQDIFSFVPFHGTPLRKICEDLGLVTPETITRCLRDKPMLVMDQYSVEEIEGLLKCFVMYIKFPKNRWPEIKKAEEDTPEGNKIYSNLFQEYHERYLPTAANVADLEYGVQH
jgi:anaerobic magnesium-protoporphyrin IX monomethyl ester cyclase